MYKIEICKTEEDVNNLLNFFDDVFSGPRVFLTAKAQRYMRPVLCLSEVRGAAGTATQAFLLG